MSPELWGKNAWVFIHFVTFGYPNNPTKKDKADYYQFFYNLQAVLPCYKCKLKYAHHLRLHPLTDKILSSKETFICWAIDLHNLVNSETNKPKLSHNTAITRLMNGTSENKSYFSILAIVFFLVLICGFIKLSFYR